MNQIQMPKLKCQINAYLSAGLSAGLLGGFARREVQMTEIVNLKS